MAYNRWSVETGEGKPPAYRWLILALMMAGDATFTVAGLSLGIMLPAITATLGLTPLQAGWLGSAVRLGTVTTSLPFSWWLSRYNAKLVNAVGLLGGGLTAIFQGLAPAYGVLFAGRLASGLAFTVRMPSRPLLIQQWFSRHEIVLVNGMAIATTGVVEAATMTLTPFLMGWLGGWRQTFLLFGLVSLLVAVVWMALGKQRMTATYLRGMRSAVGVPLRSILRYKALWAVGLGTLGAPASWWTFATFWPTYMQQHGMPLTTSGFLFGLTSLGMTPAALAVGYMASRLDIRRGILWTAGILMAGTSFISLVVRGPTLLWPVTLLWGVSWGFMPIVITVPFELPGIRPREVAISSAFLGSILLLGGAVGPAVAGAIYQVTGSLFAALAIFSILPLGLVLTGVVLPSRQVPPPGP